MARLQTGEPTVNEPTVDGLRINNEPSDQSSLLTRLAVAT